MKIIIELFFGTYQFVVSPVLKSVLGQRSFCKYKPSCSEYTKQKMLQHGILKGAFLGVVRIGRCR